MEFIQTAESTWFKLIPKQEEMINFQCWYSTLSLPVRVQEWLEKWQTLFENTTYVDYIRKINENSNIKNSLHNSSFSLHNRSIPYNHFCVPRINLGGFPKAGTTTLYNIITSHPKIMTPLVKERHFWREYIHYPPYHDFLNVAVLIYLYQFKGAANSMDFGTNSVCTIDGSASTVFSSGRHWVDINKDVCLAPILMSRFLPFTKHIFILRDPAERLWSDFWYTCSKKHVRQHSKTMTSRFEKIYNKSSEVFHNKTVLAVQQFESCVSQKRTMFECVMKANSDVGALSACKTVRLGLSLYYYHLVKWYGLFPKHNILLLRFEDLINDAANTMKKVWTFLRLEELGSDVEQLLHKVETNSLNSWMKGVESNTFKMLPETRELLATFFYPFNAKLASFINDKKFLWL